MSEVPSDSSSSGLCTSDDSFRKWTRQKNCTRAPSNCFGLSHPYLIFVNNVTWPPTFTRTFLDGKVGKKSGPWSTEKIPKCVSLSPEALLQMHVQIWNMYCCHQWLPLLCGMTQIGVHTFKIMRLHNACDLATLLVNKTPETSDLEPWFTVICQSVLIPLGLHEILAIFPKNLCTLLWTQS